MSYFDHHASAPLLPEVRALLLDPPEGNPSSVHSAGRRARARVEGARRELAASLGVPAGRVVFTSGGTEALHLAVTGLTAARAPRTILCDPGAHPALRAACSLGALRSGGALEPLPVGLDGALVDASFDAVAAAAAEGPTLLGLSLVQHETGALHGAAELRRFLGLGAVLVVDAVQGLGKLPLDLGALGAHAVAVSGHKIGALPGVGACILREGAAFAAPSGGGAQERGLRAGTENVLGIVSFGVAAGLLPRRLAEASRVASLRDAVERALGSVPGVVLNGVSRPRVPTVTHVSVSGVAGEELVAAFDLEGFCVASGAACSSGRPEPSASMLALYPEEPWRARGAMRVSLGPEVTQAEVDRFVALAPSVLRRARSA